MMWDMPRDAADLQRLADAVALRRTALRLSVDEAARRAQMSNTTWHRVEDAAGVRDTTYARVDEVLDWPPGTSQLILDDPTFRPFPTETAKGARYSQVPWVDDDVRQAYKNVTLANQADMTAAQIMALADAVVEEFRKIRRDRESGAHQ